MCALCAATTSYPLDRARVLIARISGRVERTEALASLAGNSSADAVREFLDKPTNAFEVVDVMFRLSKIADPEEVLEQAKRWDMTRAAIIGSQDNQKHALSHHHTVFGTLDLDPMAVTGLNGLGLQGLVWLAAMARGGSKPIPLLMRDLFENDEIRVVCRMSGALLAWRHLQATAETERQDFEQSSVAESKVWKGRPITARQFWLIKSLKEAVLAIEPNTDWSVPRTRGDAYDLIRAYVETRYGSLDDDSVLGTMIADCINSINEKNGFGQNPP